MIVDTKVLYLQILVYIIDISKTLNHLQSFLICWVILRFLEQLSDLLEYLNFLHKSDFENVYMENVNLQTFQDFINRTLFLIFKRRHFFHGFTWWWWWNTDDTL